jgi:thymidylate kinase
VETGTPLTTFLDSALGSKAVIVGSLPPLGRDVDLLVRASENASLSRSLAGAGFERAGSQWVRFRDCTADIVDLHSAESWGVDGAELEAVFAESVPLDCATCLCRPAPHHVLLIAARRLGRTGRLSAKRRAQIAAALEEDLRAWETARQRAERWRLSHAQLTRLQRAHARGGKAGRGISLLATLASRPRAGAVISLSGLDGAGKSSQAAALRDTLERLGFECAVEWVPFGNSWTQNTLARIGKRLLRRQPSTPSPRRAEDAQSRSTGSRLAIEAWATVGALTNAVALGWVSLRHIVRGRVVVFDRYRLDTGVYLRFWYGELSDFRVQNFLVRMLTARPRGAYLLRVAPETANARKELQYDMDELRRLARLYDEECVRQGAQVIDGEQSPDCVCAEVARSVWNSLR